VETKKEAAFDLSVSPKAAKFEAWSGQDSFERWAKTTVDANEVKRLLARPDCDWQQIHQFFEQRDLAVTMVSAGNCRLTSIQDPAASIAASKVSRLLSGTALSQKLGPYQPRSTPGVKAPAQTPAQPVSKRDPNARRDKRLERAAAEMPCSMITKSRKQKSRKSSVPYSNRLKTKSGSIMMSKSVCYAIDEPHCVQTSKLA
jgi:hypothetical protein